MGRRSVWSDASVIELTKQFAPAADEVWRLQRDDDPECRWFRRAVRGKPDVIHGSMQGTYVLTPRGKLLGRINSSNPASVSKVLAGALDKWHALPEIERRAPKAELQSVHRWADSYPERGLALQRYARDIGVDPTQAAKAPVNLDAVWFSADEVDGWLPELRVGAQRAVSERIVDRLAQVALVDNVRGQTLPFARVELGDCALQSVVLAIRGPKIDLQISGSTYAEAKGPWVNGDNYWKPSREWPRSMSTRVFGLATFDRDAKQFSQFELVAIGEGRGRTAFNGRRNAEPDATRRVGFLLQLAPRHYRVAPTFINMYGAKWVTPPPPAQRKPGKE